MNDKIEYDQPTQRPPDGYFEEKYGKTAYKVSVFFNQDGQMTAEEKRKRVILADAEYN